MSKKLKQILSILARLFIIIVAVIKIFDYFGNKESSEKEKLINTDSLEVLDNNFKSEKSEESNKVVDFKKEEKHSKHIDINGTIKYKGQKLENAYFLVDNCVSCKSSISNKTGRFKASIPNHIYTSDKEYDFYIYAKDTLVYHKSMKFSDLQFNKF